MRQRETWMRLWLGLIFLFSLLHQELADAVTPLQETDHYFSKTIKVLKCVCVCECCWGENKTGYFVVNIAHYKSKRGSPCLDLTDNAKHRKSRTNWRAAGTQLAWHFFYDVIPAAWIQLNSWCAVWKVTCGRQCGFRESRNCHQKTKKKNNSLEME